MRDVRGRFLADLPSSWMEGRTACGEASAAMALSGALAANPGLPPLRSAQISFIGPLSGEVEIRPSLLRRGRSAAFVSSQLQSNGGLGLTATFRPHRTVIRMSSICRARIRNCRSEARGSRFPPK